MIGGRVQCIAYFLSLHILAHGLGNNGGGEAKFIAFRSMLSQNMIILVYGPAVHVLYTKE